MKILIATDGSEFSTKAVEECCRLFPHLANSEIKILSVFEAEYGLGSEPFAISAGYIQEIADAAEKQARQFSSAAAELVRGKVPNGELHISLEVMQGTPAKEIVDLAESWGAELIVVGCHGRGFWGRMLGSVSDAVVHHASCSVLVVRKPKS